VAIAYRRLGQAALVAAVDRKWAVDRSWQRLGPVVVRRDEGDGDDDDDER